MLEIQVRADYKEDLLRRVVRLLAVLLIWFGETPVDIGPKRGLLGLLFITPPAQTAKRSPNPGKIALKFAVIAEGRAQRNRRHCTPPRNRFVGRSQAPPV